MTDRAIRSVAVVGGGVVGLSAAIAFARALPNARLGLIDCDGALDTVTDLSPVGGPAIHRFHAAIGLDELSLVKEGIACHHLGNTLEHWAADGAPWIDAFGPCGMPADAVPFDHVWVRAWALGKARRYDRYSTAAALMRVGKFVHPSDDRASPLSRLLYGLRMNPNRYRVRLREQARLAGVAFDRSLAGVDRGGAGIASLMLDGGDRLEADLYLDCTGPDAKLIGAVDDSVEDWSNLLPFDTVSVVAQPLDQAPQPSGLVERSDDGWTAERTAPDSLIRLAVGRAGGPLPPGFDGARTLTIPRGRRSRPWVGNVLALGEVATALDPLHGLGLDTAHAAILLALELLPGRDCSAVETAEYNRRTAEHTSRVRDFLAAHYLRSDAAAPDSLARTFDQYRARGRLPFFEEDSIGRDRWAAALIGLGFLPQSVDPVAAEIPIDQALPAMERLARELDALPAQLPTYADYLARMRSA